MAKALVRARGVATPEQFKTDWSQFMKQNIAQNIMVYPKDVSLRKSSNALLFTPAIPKCMIDKGSGKDDVFIGISFKNDLNQWESVVLSKKFSDFSVASEIGGNDFMETSAPLDIIFPADHLTVGKVYDVHFVVSNKEIAVEVAESANDLPYVLYGPASEYVVEVTCIA